MVRIFYQYAHTVFRVTHAADISWRDKGDWPLFIIIIIIMTTMMVMIINIINNNYYTRIYLNRSNSTQSAVRLKGLKPAANGRSFYVKITTAPA